MSFRPENDPRDEASGRPSDRPREEGRPVARKAPVEEGGRRRRAIDGSGDKLVSLVVGILLLALVVGAVLLWLSYGDREGGTSVFEDSVETGPEPVVRLTNGPGRVRVEGVEGLERVEISAKRYARGFTPTSARENAADVPVAIAQEGSELELSTDGGRTTGADYDLRFPSGGIVDVESATGDVEVSGLDNNVTVRAEEGDVSVEDLQGSLKIEAPRGDVTVEAASTETGRVEILVDSGDVALEDIVVGIMEARVESGDVTLSGRFSGSGRVFVETGNISVQLPPEDIKDLEVQARVGEVEHERGSG